MTIVKKSKKIPRTQVRWNLKQELVEQIILYAEMLEESEPVRIVEELLDYALKRDSDFQKYKKVKGGGAGG